MQINNIDHHILWPSRCSIEKWDGVEYDCQNDINPNTEKSGIRCHNWLTAFFLRIIGKISTFKLENGEKVYLNKNSFNKWKEWRALETTSQDADLAKKIPTTDSQPSNPLPASTPLHEEGSIEEKSIPPNPFPASTPFREEGSIEEKSIPPNTSKPEVEDPNFNGSSVFDLQPTSLNKIVKLISDTSDNDLGEIWNKFFSHFESGVMRGWKQEKNTLIITLTRQVSVWINSESGPKGGSIFILGDDEANEFRVELSRGKMNFESGFKLLYNKKSGIKSIPVYRMTKDGDGDQIGFKAGKSHGFTPRRSKGKSASEYIREWTEGIALGEGTNHEEFLKDKQKELAAPVEFETGAGTEVYNEVPHY